MAIHKSLNNFTAGEVTPFLDARIDLQKYDNACRTMENMRVLPWGGARYRSGTLALARTGSSGAPVRLMSFQYSTDISYVLEFRNFLIRVYNSDGTLVLNGGGTPLEIATIYDGRAVPVGSGPDTLWEIQGKQINDVLYLVHPSYPVQKFKRLTSTTFSIETVAWKYPALLDENVDGTTTIAASATTGSVTLTSNADIFNSSHVSSYWEIRHLRDAATDIIDISASSGTTTGTALEVVGDWTVTTTQYWNGSLYVERSTDGGSTWTVARKSTRKGSGNTTISGTENAPNVGKPRVQLRIKFIAAGDPYGTPPWVGTAPTAYIKASATIEVANAYIAGLFIVTAYTDTKHVTATVLSSPVATTATTIWSEGAWSTYRGFPRAIGLYEQRVIYAGTTHQPNTMWGSTTADFENFLYSDLDDGAIAIQFAATEQNPVQWLASLTMLNGSSSGGEFSVRSGNSDEAMTPSNVVVRGKTNFGSEYVQPLLIANGIIFVQRQGTRLRELHEVSAYADPGENNTADISILAEHITSAGIKQIAFAHLPDPTIYVVLKDGTLAVVTYNKEQNVTAWARWTTTGGGVVSVATIYGNPADSVFIAVQRGTASGQPQYVVEGLTAETQDAVNGVFLDSAYRFNDGSAHTNFIITDRRYESLASSVSVVADGVVLDSSQFVIANSGFNNTSLTLSAAATVVTIGLPYTGILKPMKIDSQIGNGTTQGRKRRISEVVVRFLQSVGCRYGNSTTNDPATGRYCETLEFRESTDDMDAQIPLFTGDKQLIPWPGGGSDLSGDIVISQTQPLPMTVLGLFAKFESLGE